MPWLRTLTPEQARALGVPDSTLVITSVRCTGIVSHHEGELHSRQESPATISIAYFRQTSLEKATKPEKG